MTKTVAALRSALAYDPTAPLRPEIEQTEDELEISISRIRYEGIKRQRVTAILVEPTGDGPFPAVVFLHPFSGDKFHFLAEAKDLAGEGIVSLLIDAPHKRPQPHQLIADIRDPKSVRSNHLQLIGDIRRGYDVLEQLETVEHDRLGFIGQREGADLAPSVSLLEPRVMAAVAIDITPRRSVFWTTSDAPEAKTRRDELGAIAMRSFTRTIADFDAATLMPHALSNHWLFQLPDGSSDLESELQACTDSAEFQYFDTGELDSVAAERARYQWLENVLRPR